MFDILHVINHLVNFLFDMFWKIIPSGNEHDTRVQREIDNYTGCKYASRK